jgi:hypothetical protein
MPAPFRYDERFSLAVTPEGLWSALERTDRYVDWWSWLQVFECDGLQSGDVARCVVRAPLPYSLRFTVHVDEVVTPERIVTHVDGDLVGPARLEILSRPDGCEARLAWELELRDPVLRPLATLTRPAMQWAHDRVVQVGLVEFRRHALDGHGRA